MISIKNLHKSYKMGSNSLHVLKGINLKIEKGELVAIMGSSGSGKSTLLNILGMLDNADDGSYHLDDVLIENLDEKKAAKYRNKFLGFVFQSFQLLPSLTALEIVMLPIELKGDSAAKEKATDLLDRVGLSERWHHYPNQLSGGEQQRIAIARAFATEARILFADEPTGNLDTATGAKIVELLFDLNKAFSTTLVLVTHDERLAARCDRQVRLVAGEVVAQNGNGGK